MPLASISGISPTVDEPTAGDNDSALVTVTGSGLEDLTTLEIGSVSYKEYPCPPAKLSPVSPKLPLTPVPTATCDPAGPLDLHGQEFAVYDNGHTIVAPDPQSAVDYEPNPSSTLPAPGSTVGVTGLEDGQTVPSSASYSFPLGEMYLRGPLDWEGVTGGTTNYPPFGGMEWTQGNGSHSISVSPPDPAQALTYTTTSPSLHLFATFADSGETEHPPPASDPNGAIASTQKGWTVGNGGKYAAEVFWCKPIVGSPTGSGCTDYQGDPGKWTPVGSVHTVTLERVAGQMVGTDLDLPLGAAFGPTQLVGTFKIVMSEFETDSNDCVGPACGEGPTALPSDGAPCFDQSNSIASPSSYNDEYTGTNPGPLQRVQCATSPNFNVVVQPVAWLQLSAIPYTILYFPPGDQSKSTQTLADSFGTNFALNGSRMQSNSTAVMTSGSTKFSFDFSYGGFGLSDDQTAGWSTTDELGYTLNNGTNAQSSAGLSLSLMRTLGPDVDLVPGTGDQCASSTNCLPADYVRPVTQYLNEPFWNDVFVLEVHPQFALYRFGSGQDEYVQRGADPDLAAITVAQLNGCASGADPANVDSWCSIPVTTSFAKVSGPLGGKSIQGVCPAPASEPEACLTLPPSEAAHLLSLDPFYVGGQNALIVASRGTAITGSEPYGSVFTPSNCSSSPSTCNRFTSPTPVADNALAFTPTLQNTQATMSTITGSQTDETTITNVVSNQESEGASVKVNESPVSAGESLTFSGSDQTTTKDSISTTFGNSNAVSGQHVSMDMATLYDIDNSSASGSCSKCHNPLPAMPAVTVYLDRLFGTFMFQDAGAPGPPPGGLKLAQVGHQLLNAIGQAEQSAGVPASSPQRVPVAQVLGLGIMSAPGDKFDSGEPFTQSQLASAFAALFHVSTSETMRLFTDSHAGAGGGVTEGQLSAALAEAFGLGSTPASELVQVSTATFSPSVIMTRGQAAETLAAAIEEHCLAGCSLPKAALARGPTPAF